MIKQIELVEPKKKTRYVVRSDTGGFWRTRSYGSRITGCLNDADLFKTKIGAFFSYFDMIFDGSAKITKVKVEIVKD